MLWTPTHGAEPHTGWKPFRAVGSAVGEGLHKAYRREGHGCSRSEGSSDLAGGTGFMEEAVAAGVCHDVPGPDSAPGRAGEEGAAPTSAVTCTDDE